MSIFSHVYWPFIFLSMWTACSWPLPICCHLAFHLFLIDLLELLVYKGIWLLVICVTNSFPNLSFNFVYMILYPGVLNYTVKLIILFLYGSWVWRSCFKSLCRWVWFKSCTDVFLPKNSTMDVRARKDLTGCII